MSIDPNIIQEILANAKVSALRATALAHRTQLTKSDPT